jgi:molecular chaperone Hsp33
MQESKLFSFLDKKNSFTLHFLEGQKTIHDMAIMHQLSGSGFAYYRDILLSTIPLIYLLKKEESFGFYLDSENPFFRFKLEVSYLGNYRTLMLPDNFNQFPEKLSGQLRFSKIVSNMNPYTTIMEIKDQSFAQAINQLLHDSYQIESSLHVSDISDQSLIISKIPREDVGRIIVEPTMPIKDYINKMGKDFFSIFSEAFSDDQKIIDWFSAKDLLFLGTKNFKFHCPCSKDRMMTNLSVLTDEDLLHIFEEKNKLEITCDYCHKVYNFDREEIKKVHLKN